MGTMDIITGVCSAITAVAGAALIIWKIFLPHIAKSINSKLNEMRGDIAEQKGKVDEIHQQTTVNHHSSPEPTILDRLDDNTSLTKAQGAAIAEQGQQIRDLTGMFTQHMDDSRQDRRDFQELRETVHQHLQESALVWAEARRPRPLISIFGKR